MSKGKVILWIIIIMVILATVVFVILLFNDKSNEVGHVEVGTKTNPDCSEDLYNCGDFETQAEAQEVFDSCNGKDNDIHRLDSDGDGIVCEGLS